MDQTTVRAVDELTRMELDVEAAAFVLVQSDAVDAPAVMASCEEICTRHQARSALRTEDAEEGRQLLLARRMALPALEKKGVTLLDDVVVPKPQLPEMFRRIGRAAREHGVVIGTFGHAGDGNLHPTIVFEAGDQRSRAAAGAAFDAIVRDALALGGSISGEHGIGSLKPGYLTAMLGATERELMRRIKASFDPRGILNPGRAIQPGAASTAASAIARSSVMVKGLVM